MKKMVSCSFGYHHWMKLLSVAVRYGWFGVVYGILLALTFEEYGVAFAPWLKGLFTLAIAVFTVAWAYRIEMRYHMPSSKYGMIVSIALVGIIGSVFIPYLYPLSFLLFFISIAYKCNACVAFRGES